MQARVKGHEASRDEVSLLILNKNFNKNYQLHLKHCIDEVYTGLKSTGETVEKPFNTVNEWSLGVS
jgi:hypothetical protein